MKMKIKLIIFLMIFLIFNVYGEYYLDNQLDINMATLEQIKLLPIDEKLAEKIFNYKEFHSYFETVYDLRKIEEMDQENFDRIKPLIFIKIPKTDDISAQRLDQFYYLFTRQGDDEGFSEGTADEWIDLLVSPININKSDFFDIYNLPNVSPTDAASVSDTLEKRGRISSRRSLRRVPGLTGWGYRNIRNYVSYSETEEDKGFHLYYQFLYEDTPYREDEEEAFESLKQKYVLECPFLENYIVTRPALMNKLRVRWGHNLKLGVLTNKNVGDDWDFARTYKAFADYKFWKDRIRVLVGNYRLAFGQGLVMENTDYYTFRKTGMGFSKRITGMIGDTSRTEVFQLKGVATEFNIWNFSLNLFYSEDKKDAILNEDGTVQTYIINVPSFTNEHLEQMGLMHARDVLDEKLVGGHIQYNFAPGIYIGYTEYKARNDRYFHPLDRDEFYEQIIDKEIKNTEGNTIKEGYDYGDYAEKIKPLVNNDYFFQYDNTEFGKFRKVQGVDFMTVIDNIAMQGEYATQYRGGDAKLLSVYTEYNSLYLLVLYRDYDLEFDNPYMSAFSEKKRFEDTMFEKNNYMFLNPTLGSLYSYSHLPQPEQGIYLETRYQINRKWTINRAYIDVFKRKADDRKTMRFQGEIEFKPIFPLRLRLKQKWLANKMDNDIARSISRSSETTFRIRFNLLNFDNLDLEYFHGMVWLPPYPYLSNNAEPGVDNLPTGTTLMHGSAYTASYKHYLKKDFSIMGAITYWDNPGGTSIWDWEDTRIDFMSYTGTKYWLVLDNKVSRNLSIRFKYWYKRYLNRENDQRTWWNDDLYVGGYEEPQNNVFDYLPCIAKKQSAFKFYIIYQF